MPPEEVTKAQPIVDATTAERASFRLVVIEGFDAGRELRLDGDEASRVLVGKGPTASGIAAPGYHDVRVENAGHESKSVVEVRVGKVARVESTQLP